MSIGIGYVADGMNRGMERRRGIDIQEDNIAMAKEDRKRKIANETQDRGISVPLARSNADTSIAKNEASNKLRPGETENTAKKQVVNGRVIDHAAKTLAEKQALADSKVALDAEQTKVTRTAIPKNEKLTDSQRKVKQKKADHEVKTVDKKLMQQDEVDDMAYETKQMEFEIAKTLQGPRSAEAEAKIAETQHKIYGNVYTIAKSDPARAAQMVNDVKSNGITTAADITFEDGMMRIVDAQGQVLEDPKYGLAEFNINDMEAAFGSTDNKDDPSIVRVANWLVKNDIAKDESAAWDMANKAKSNPEDMAMDIAKSMKKFDRDSYRRPLADLYKEALAVLTDSGQEETGGDQYTEGQQAQDADGNIVTLTNGQWVSK